MCGMFSGMEVHLWKPHCHPKRGLCVVPHTILA